MRFKSGLILAAVAGLAIASSARAAVLVTGTYDDLSGQYDAVNGFSARAVNNAFLQSYGTVSRIVANAGDATFDPGFVSLAGLSDFQLTCSVVITGPHAATGSGSFTSTDANGDTITGTVTGAWGSPAPGFIYFNGSLSNVTLNNTSGDGRFNGSNGDSWDMNIPAIQPLAGAIVQLVFGGTTFFTAPFGNRAVGIDYQVIGNVIPAPGAMALMGLAGAVAFRRRTR